MVSRSTVSTASTLTALGLVAAACSSGGSTVGNTSPRINAIPQQLTPGGTALTLDVEPYVTDRENDTLTFSVVAGGGDFTGSVYTHTFAAMGAYQVAFKVTDAANNATMGTFDVDVLSSDFAVVTENSTGLMLLDSDTNQLVVVAQSVSLPTFAAGLADGRMVFTRGQGAAQTLSIFDPFTRRTRQIAAGEPQVTYRAHTSDGQVVFTTGAPADTDLYLFNPRTNLITELSATAGQVDGGALVNGQDLVFYERGNGGQNDIYYFDPATATTFPVGTDVNDEQLLGALSNGAVVFSRVGAGGETDLFYFERGTGLVEVGANTPALATLDKAVGAFGNQGQVVFTAVNGADVEVWAWDPANGVATPIATGGVHGVDGIGAGNEVVYRVVNGPADQDLWFYDLDDGATDVVLAGNDVSSLLALTGDGATNWAIAQGDGSPNTVAAVPLVASPSGANYAAGGAAEFCGTLRGGDVVARRTDGTAICRFDVSAGVWDAPIAGAGILYGGDGVDAGDFVFSQTVAAQQDLTMWDDSAVGTVVVSDTAGLDTFRARSLSGTVLFTRIVGTNTNHDLFAWDPVAGETRITDVDAAGLRFNYDVVATYTGTR